MILLVMNLLYFIIFRKYTFLYIFIDGWDFHKFVDIIVKLYIGNDIYLVYSVFNIYILFVFVVYCKIYRPSELKELATFSSL